MRFLIIGGGVAGTTAAQELRARDAQADITILSEEHHPLYSRVLLPHYLTGKVVRERVFLKREDWYGQQRIEWVPGVVAIHLDARNKFVGASDGREYPFDKLLIATGGQVRNIEDDLRGVSYLRTLDDADHFLQLVTQQGTSARGAIYGGGFIACEYVNLFAHFEIPVVLAHRGAHFWTGVLEPEAGALIAQTLREGGVELMADATLVSLEGEHELEAVVTNKGERAATILGVGIGVEPDLVWLREAGVEVRAGIKVNEFLETNVPDVYAAGDSSEFYDVVVERQRLVGNWMNAMAQARTAAASMSGERTAFRLVSSYATHLLGLEMIFVGDVEKAAAHKIHIIGSAQEGGVTQVFERNGRVVGAAILGRNSDRTTLTKAIHDNQAFVAVQQHLAIDKNAKIE